MRRDDSDGRKARRLDGGPWSEVGDELGSTENSDRRGCPSIALDAGSAKDDSRPAASSSSASTRLDDPVLDHSPGMCGVAAGSDVSPDLRDSAPLDGMVDSCCAELAARLRRDDLVAAVGACGSCTAPRKNELSRDGEPRSGAACA